LSVIALALSPADRLEAAKKLGNDSNDYAVPSWLIWTLGITVAVLVVSIIAVKYKQKSKRAGRAG
jgi:hypothetical protein